MIRILKIVGLVLGSVVLQTALISRISMFGSTPDLPLALVVSVALFMGPFHGELVGFISGILYDLLSGARLLGVEPFSRIVIGYSIGFIRGRLYSDNFITQLASGFAATLAHKAITFIHQSLLGIPSLSIRFPGLILAAIFNAVLVVAVFRMLKRVAGGEN